MNGNVIQERIEVKTCRIILRSSVGGGNNDAVWIHSEWC